MTGVVCQHLDTQVISYAMKGKWERSIQGAMISSIVANEFLLVQSEELAQANWYIPLLSRCHSNDLPPIELRQRDHPFRKESSDSIIMDFGNEFPTVVEYNSLSIANAINEGHVDLFVGATNHLDKPLRKRLVSRFRFIVDNEIGCTPLQQRDVQHAFSLLGQFRREHNLKQNFRNSWNDLLILSSARNAEVDLITEDNELSRFASNVDGGTSSRVDDFIRIQFPRSDQQPRRPSRESKGYTNVGWRVQFNRVQKSSPE